MQACLKIIILLMIHKTRGTTLAGYSHILANRGQSCQTACLNRHQICDFEKFETLNEEEIQRILTKAWQMAGEKKSLKFNSKVSNRDRSVAPFVVTGTGLVYGWKAGSHVPSCAKQFRSDPRLKQRLCQCKTDPIIAGHAYKLSKPNQSCSAACEERNLLCDFSNFQHLSVRAVEQLLSEGYEINFKKSSERLHWPEEVAKSGTNAAPLIKISTEVVYGWQHGIRPRCDVVPMHMPEDKVRLCQCRIVSKAMKNYQFELGRSGESCHSTCVGVHTMCDFEHFNELPPPHVQLLMGHVFAQTLDRRDADSSLKFIDKLAQRDRAFAPFVQTSDSMAYGWEHTEILPTCSAKPSEQSQKIERLCQCVRDHEIYDYDFILSDLGMSCTHACTERDQICDLEGFRDLEEDVTVVIIEMLLKDPVLNQSTLNWDDKLSMVNEQSEAAPLVKVSDDIQNQLDVVGWRRKADKEYLATCDAVPPIDTDKKRRICRCRHPNRDEEEQRKRTELVKDLLKDSHYVCEDRWQLIENNCYRVLEDSRGNLFEAENICGNLNARLPEFVSSSSLKELSENLRISLNSSKSFNLGLDCDAKEKTPNVTSDALLTESGCRWQYSDKPLTYAIEWQNEQECQNNPENCQCTQIGVTTSQNNSPMVLKWKLSNCDLPSDIICQKKAEKRKDVVVCPRGWFVAGSNCFYINKTFYASHWAARENCSAMQASLLTFPNIEDYEQFVKEARKSISRDVAIHLGLTSLDPNGTLDKAHWQWMADNSSILEFTNFWAFNQPDNAAKRPSNCARIHSTTWKWFDVPCSAAGVLICQKEALIVPAFGESSTCRDEWKTYKGSCIRVNSSFYSSYWAAKRNCTVLGGSLPEFETIEEYEDFADFLDSAELNSEIDKNASRSIGQLSFHLGIRSIDENGTLNKTDWQWDASMSKLNFEDGWGAGQPNNHAQLPSTCARMRGPDWDWFDAPCSASASLVCQYKLPTSSETTPDENIASSQILESTFSPQILESTSTVAPENGIVTAHYLGDVPSNVTINWKLRLLSAASTSSISYYASLLTAAIIIKSSKWAMV